MPKAPRWAQVGVISIAALVLVYVVSVARLSEAANGSTRTVFPGQLVTVHLNSSWDLLRSSDPSVVEPIRVTLTPTAIGYFIALRPGRATLEAVHSPPCRQCLSLSARWSVQINVWPSG